MKNTENTKQEPYGFIKNMRLIEKAYFDPRLQEQTKLMLSLLVRYADQNGIIKWFSVKETALGKQVSRRAIQNQIDKLIIFGYLQKAKNKGVDWRNKYFLIYSNINKNCHVTLLGDTPHVTQSGHTHDTSLDHTPCDLIESHNENYEIKKEKGASPRDDFLDRVKEENKEHAFQEIGNFSETFINSRALACWTHWEATGDFPKGNYIAAFKGWLYNGLHNNKIKETSAPPKNSNALQREHVAEPKNPIQNWHKQIELIVGTGILKSWFRECWHDGNGKLCAPSKFTAQRIKEQYSNEIAQILPNVTIVHQPYKGGIHEKAI